MELVTQLEEKFNKLLNKINELKEDNQRLREEVEAERQTRHDIESRIDTLLEKIQNELE
ncbi:cell division protein ZapB [uncultured Pseudodesulfovibrio sp.]|uniref:cell division protein ZapB n=1 Tax=uncultured Pseudodesulfovibrio sp. TaxID=2035858 RepID=UPI0029C76EC6|nr:cell division protein ZapB [uncultured Pseudodesulfovibrio sp.]